jgi:3-deoxy-7-phosphoheptulonate synthase
MVLDAIAAQVAGGSPHVMGVMMESFLVEGRQNHEDGKPLKYGQSITDACMSWERTEPQFAKLQEAVRKRRSA